MQITSTVYTGYSTEEVASTVNIYLTEYSVRAVHITSTVKIYLTGYRGRAVQKTSTLYIYLTEYSTVQVASTDYILYTTG